MNFNSHLLWQTGTEERKGSALTLSLPLNLKSDVQCLSFPLDFPLSWPTFDFSLMAFLENAIFSRKPSSYSQARGDGIPLVYGQHICNSTAGLCPLYSYFPPMATSNSPSYRRVCILSIASIKYVTSIHLVSDEMESLNPIWYSFNQNICKLISLHLQAWDCPSSSTGERTYHFSLRY